MTEVNRSDQLPKSQVESTTTLRKADSLFTHAFNSITAKVLNDDGPSDFRPDSRFRGFHILLDYSGFETKNPEDLSDWTMNTIQAALKANEIRCVHSHSEVFQDVRDAETPPGFTAVCLLDESHVSAHCYSAIGLLAIDVFTCGGKPNQTFAAARDIHRAVMGHLPCSFMGSSTFRFPYRIGSPMTDAESC
jgi:S-adenosylmethionine/arginine decarboxylase-like enzyme